jgi:hypothetical protein
MICNMRPHMQVRNTPARNQGWDAGLPFRFGYIAVLPVHATRDPTIPQIDM